ncbi:Uncharacterised protein [Arthrobacter agilis]|nr:Uncharacterised protein [Arthrobacter agilis]
MRFLLGSLGALAVLASLSGCSQGAPSPVETVLIMPASPSAEAARSAVPSTEPSPADPTGRTDGSAEAEAASDPSDHCVMVAGGVTTVMLAPLSLGPSSTHQQLVVLEQQILDLREKMPAELSDDFTALAHTMEAPPEGSGTFDEVAFRQAILPVEDWLDRHCATR